MTTYRDLLTPVFGADALREAEARVYDRRVTRLSQWMYCCADGYCALGIMLRGQSLRGKADPRFPFVVDVEAALDLKPAVSDALDIIVTTNDMGEFRAPGTLTALLDSEV